MYSLQSTCENRVPFENRFSTLEVKKSFFFKRSRLAPYKILDPSFIHKACDLVYTTYCHKQLNLIESKKYLFNFDGLH